VFNMGLGMIIVTSSEQTSEVKDKVPEAIEVGRVIEHKDSNRVQFRGRQ
jgi:phosphoribosylaminoimidazole (AIR) synthetase